MNVREWGLDEYRTNYDVLSPAGRSVPRVETKKPPTVMAGGFLSTADRSHQGGVTGAGEHL